MFYIHVAKLRMSFFFIECVQNKTLREQLFTKICNTDLTFNSDQPLNQLQKRNKEIPMGYSRQREINNN